MAAGFVFEPLGLEPRRAGARGVRFFGEDFLGLVVCPFLQLVFQPSLQKFSSSTEL